MAVVFSSTRALLAIQATALAAEATLAGLGSLSAALTDLSTEISTTNSSITENEFFGGGTTSYTFGVNGGGSGSGTDKDSAALVWTQSLMTASNIIATKNINSIRDHFVATDSTKFWQTVSSIAGDVQNIAENQTVIADKQTTIADKQTTIAEKQTAMETYQKKLKELGEGNGIRVIGPYELVQFITTYRTLIEEGKLLSWRDKTVSDKEVNKALNDLGKYIEKIRQNIPKDF